MVEEGRMVKVRQLNYGSAKVHSHPEFEFPHGEWVEVDEGMARLLESLGYEVEARKPRQKKGGD